jgi:hypothetical protein
MILRKIVLSLLLFHLLAVFAFADRPRVIVSTDIGGGDADDFQSMVHFLVYADLFNVEGLISSPPLGGRKSDIEEVLDKYRIDYTNLKTYGPYPTYNELIEVTKQGAISGGSPGSGKSTEGSNFIIAAAQKNDPRPLWILVWGSMTDVAQALYDDSGIKSKIRVYSIGSWNTSMDEESRNYIYNNHHDLWWIENDFTFRGMYKGGNQSGDLENKRFVENHVNNHVELGNLFYNKKTTIKMGDTPSVLYLLSPIVGGVGDLDDPTGESWGGQFKNTSHGQQYWTDIHDDEIQDGASVNKWREQYLRDWEKRMDRCLEENANTDTLSPSSPTTLVVQ